MPRGGIVLSMVWGFQGEGGEDAISKISGSICERFILDCTHTYIHIQKQESQETKQIANQQSCLWTVLEKAAFQGMWLQEKLRLNSI